MIDDGAKNQFSILSKMNFKKAAKKDQPPLIASILELKYRL